MRLAWGCGPPCLPKVFGLSSRVAEAGSCPVTPTAHNKHADLALFLPHCQVPCLLRAESLPWEGWLVMRFGKSPGHWKAERVQDPG